MNGSIGLPRFISLLAASLACAAALSAQAADRLPVIAGAMHVYVLVEADGTVQTWGSPHDAEGPYLGDGTDGYVKERKEPAPLPGVADIADAAVGPQHVLLLKRDGTVLSWGRNNGCEVGSGDEKRRLSPEPVAGLRGVRQVAAAESLSGAVLDDGTVWMWGSNAGGHLANGRAGYAEPCAMSPVKVEGLTGVKRIAMDGANVLVLKEDGTVWGWGRGGGALGDGTTEKRLRPVQMQGIANAVDIAIDGNSVVLLADGTVRMSGGWGAEMGEAKKGPAHTTPVKIPGVADAVAVRTAQGATMVRLKNGTLLGWGNGYFGKLGDGRGNRESGRETATPHAPIGLGPVLAHYYASNSGFAIRADGQVMAWGIFSPDGKDEWVTKPIPLFKVKLAD